MRTKRKKISQDTKRGISKIQTKAVDKVVTDTILEEYYSKGKKLPYKELEEIVLRKVKPQVNLSDEKIIHRIKRTDLARDVVKKDILTMLNKEFKTKHQVKLTNKLGVNIGKKLGLSSETIMERIMEMIRNGIIDKELVKEKNKTSCYLVRKK